MSQALNSAPGVQREPSSRRPTCLSCAKPLRLCLCNRVKTPNLNNSVHITILQHSLERNHPLNSTRIATIGLKNLSVVSVSDVNFEARLTIRLLDADSEKGCETSDGAETMSSGSKRLHFDQFSDSVVTQNEAPDLGTTDSEPLFSWSTSGERIVKKESKVAHENKRIRVETHFTERLVIALNIQKYGAISSFQQQLMLQTVSQNPTFDLLLASPLVLDALAKGFVVKKWQNKQLTGNPKVEEIKEFEIMVPPGSALLFPSEKSVGIEAVNFEVKNLIVLDGTWAKAKRMYNENPWLKLLPHLKLDLDKKSLYSEVRHQPRAGYLSTIESIVYALKAVGDESGDGLDNLLEVFESMVRDQRRCKDERLNRVSPD